MVNAPPTAGHARSGRAFQLLVVLLALQTLSSCATHRELVAQPDVGASAGARDWHATEIARGSHRIVGYRLVDGTYQSSESKVRLVGDSLEFEAVTGRADAVRVVRPASEVAAVDLFAASPAGVLIAAALVVVLAMIAVYGYGL
jgi:hypothetical protein